MTTPRGRATRAARQPTWTHQVLAALVAADDFLSIAELRARTKATTNQLNATLHHLHSRKAVDNVVGADGRLWWFATPQTDTRHHEVAERTPEEVPRKPRQRRVKISTPLA